MSHFELARLVVAGAIVGTVLVIGAVYMYAIAVMGGAES